MEPRKQRIMLHGAPSKVSSVRAHPSLQNGDYSLSFTLDGVQGANRDREVTLASEDYLGSSLDRVGRSPDF
jgi:hypothetical protein